MSQTHDSANPIAFSVSIHAPIARADVYAGSSAMTLRFGEGGFYPEAAIFFASHEDAVEFRDAINAVAERQVAARRARENAGADTDHDDLAEAA